MESFVSSRRTEWAASRVRLTNGRARANVFDIIDRFYHLRRRHSVAGHPPPKEFELNAMSA